MLRISALAAVMAGLATPSMAVVGPTQPAGPLAANVVMVLQRAAHSAGFCTGVIVAADAVLTAAHCVAGAADTRVHFRDDDGKSVLLDVAEVVVNPGFRRDAIRTRERSIDLALVRLQAPLPGPFVAAALAGEDAVAVGRRFRIAGYGLAREGEARTGGVLRTAVLAARAPLSSILLWAGDPTGQGAGACTGDSGAPLYNDAGEVAAITSWAAGYGSHRCGDLTQAALLQPQRSWIGAILRRWAKS